MKNEYTVDFALIKSWIKEGRFKGKRLVFFLGYLIMGTLLLVSSIFYIVRISSIEADLIHWIYAYFCLLFSAFAFYRAFIHHYLLVKVNYKRLCKMQGSSSWTTTVCFEDDFIHLSEGAYSVKCSYDDIKSVKETDAVIYLYMTNGGCIRLFVDAFSEGSWEECAALLREKNQNL